MKNPMQYLPNGVTRTVARQALKVRSNSPTLMFGAGVVGVVATVVLASKATLRLDEILDDTNAKLDDINTVEHGEYTSAERTTDRAIVFTRTAIKITKLYGPSVIVGVASISCLTGAHVTLTRRNAGLVAAYAALEKGFKQYRDRVLEDVGEDKEREYRYGSVTVDEKRVDDKGNVKTTKVKQVSPEGASIYAKFFDETSTSWKRNAEYNKIFLRAQQRFAQEKLQMNGYLFLNEVYESLGLERTKAGQVVGWILTPDTDNYVDFGIFDGDNERKRAFVNGNEAAILLDFNVTSILDKI